MTVGELKKILEVVDDGFEVEVPEWHEHSAVHFVPSDEVAVSMSQGSIKIS